MFIYSDASLDNPSCFKNVAFRRNLPQSIQVIQKYVLFSYLRFQFRN